MRLNGSAYRMIDPSMAVFVTINRDMRGTEDDDMYYKARWVDIQRRNIQTPEAPDYSHMEDRFFWMLWEEICKIEATQFNRARWSLL